MYIGECSGTDISINSGIEEPNHEYQNGDTSQILIFGEYVTVRESLYTRVVFWLNTILNHIDTRTILPKYEGCCMVHRPKW